MSAPTNKTTTDAITRLEKRVQELEAALRKQREEMDRQLARHLCYTSEGIRAIFWREFDAAIARRALGEK